MVSVAQSVERRSVIPVVVGSIPIAHPTSLSRHVSFCPNRFSFIAFYLPHNCLSLLILVIEKYGFTVKFERSLKRVSSKNLG